MFYKIGKEAEYEESHTINLNEVLYVNISCIRQDVIYICFKNGVKLDVNCGSTKEGLKTYNEITNKLINLNN